MPQKIAGDACRRCAARAGSKTCIWLSAILGSTTGSHLENVLSFFMWIPIKMTDLSSFLEHLLFWIPFGEHGNIQIPLPKLHFKLCIHQTPTLLLFPLPTWLCQHRQRSGSFHFQPLEALLNLGRCCWGQWHFMGSGWVRQVSLCVKLSSPVAWSVRTSEGTLALLHSTQIGHLKGSSVVLHAGGGWTSCSGCHWVVTAVVSFKLPCWKAPK